MLAELRVENLVLIERAELRLTAGLNVLTGETGAGKTVLAHAMDLLLGGRARPGIVRPGAAEAYVEGAFELPDGLAAGVAERLAPDAPELVLARRVAADGRTRAYVNGRSATVSDLRQVGGELLAFYGQHEHRKLTLASAQLELLDGFCGDQQAADRAGCAASHALAREAQEELDRLAELGGARERELDLLRFELAEIEEIGPEEAEYAELVSERERLRHLDALTGAAIGAAEAVAGADDPGAGPGAVTLLAGAGAALDRAGGVDPQLDALGERQRALTVEAEELARELRAYGEGLEVQPGRLEQVEERLADVERLMRKHGGSVSSVLDHAAQCRRRCAELDSAEEATGRARARLAEAQGAIGRHAGALRRRRRAAAPRLARAVQARLADLAMEGATFEVELSQRPAGPTGADGVEFRIAPNPGVPAGPVREIASGGELSRVMLALMGAASAGGAPTLVFDEVDAGIGGHTARAVGEALRELARHRQVLCITHLPQVASLAKRHFSIAKDDPADRPREGATTRAEVRELAEAEVVGELVRMLGADGGDAAARRHARELRRAA